MLANLRKRVMGRLARRKFAPTIVVQPSTDLLRLGSASGGWTFEASADLLHSTIVSGGLGEDASFDVEFASRFLAKVVIVDPTPRAMLHFKEIQERIGQPALQGYASGGRQPATSYDLSKIAKDTLQLEPSALWIENTTLRFFAPAIPDHVSYSIVNLQNKYSQETAHIEVAGVTLEDLLEKYNLKTPPLMKLDIEGAEIDVVRHMLEKSILPRQLLAEFDEMNYPSDRSKKNAEDTDRLLRDAGYLCRHFDGLSNLLYVLR